jgi:hypothetical protein
MEYYNNILCIEAGWLIENEILSKPNYDKLTRIPKGKKESIIKVIRRGCLTSPALVAYDSIPERFKRQIIALIGDPYKVVHKSKLTDTITPDPKALIFYRDDFRLENGDQLPVDVQKEYCTNAEILNAIHVILSEKKPAAKTINGSSKGFWPNMAEAVLNLDKTVFKHSLPPYPKFDEDGNQLPLSASAYRRLQDKYNKYIDESYKSLIHGNWCNTNSEKVNDEARYWILSRWTSMVNKVANEQQLMSEYNEHAPSQEWKQIKNVATIHNFLYEPEIKRLWWGHRYGELKFKEKFVYQQKTILPTMRDSLWYSDGTKLNYFYQYRGAKGEFKMGTTSVYEVMDVYSEAMLGYFISDTEDYVAQYNAYRMALQTSGCKPYQITYDNQGGHKKLESGDFLTKLSHLSIRTQPYNGKSKTIESAFNRFQQQFLKKDWFFTGQNIQSKANESKANMEYIMANKHMLPTLEEVKATYLKRRNEWQNAPHFKTGIAKIKMYNESQNQKAVKLELMDMVDLFWVLREKPVTCSAYGISFEEKKEQYDFMVNQANGLPDVKWLASNIDRKFRIKFDPLDFSIIYLYEDTPQGLRFVTSADQKVEVHRGKQEQEDWEAQFFKDIEKETETLRIETQNYVRTIQEKHNDLPEQHGFVTPKIKGINSKSTAKKAKQPADNFGRIQKAMSNAVMAGIDDEDFDENDLYKMM